VSFIEQSPVQKNMIERRQFPFECSAEDPHDRDTTSSLLF
jgi:hypothetical protein